MRTVFRSLTFSALLATAAACGGDPFEIVDEGDLRCAGTCEMVFQSVDPLRENNSELKLTIENVGRGDLEIRSIRLEDTSPLVRFSATSLNDYLVRGGWTVNPDGHTFTIDDPIVLSSNALLEVELIFGPATSAGASLCPGGDPRQCGFVVVESNDRNPEEAVIRQPIVINLGTGNIAVNPTVIEFPDPQPGRTFNETFEVSNTGVGVLTVTSITVADQTVTVESGSALPLPIRINPNGKHEFDVTWAPTTTDPLATAIVVQSDDPDTRSTAVTLRSGAGNAARIEVNPCNIAFQEPLVGEPNEVTFDVANTGGAAMTWSVSLTEFQPTDARAEFLITRAGATGDVQGQQDPIAPEGSRTYSMVYTPTADRSVAGNMRFTGNFGATVNCPFRAGPAAPGIEVVPNRLFWGGVAPGETVDRTFVVYNIGRAALEVSGMTLAETGDVVDEYSVEDAAAGGFTVAPGGSRRVTVTFSRARSDVGANDDATITIQHNDPLVPPVRVQLEANHDDAVLPPTCDLQVSAEEPYTAGQTISFDATGSTVADGTAWSAPNRFLWTLEVPESSEAVLTAQYGDTTSLTFDTPGRYSVALTATAQVGANEVSCEFIRNLLVAP